jgi:hypothetical protein
MVYPFRRSMSPVSVWPLSFRLLMMRLQMPLKILLNVLSLMLAKSTLLTAPAPYFPGFLITIALFGLTLAGWMIDLSERPA